MTPSARILLIVSGGIAAYKSLELIRRGRDRGMSFRVILTRGGAEFVTPLSFASISGEKVYQELFSLTDESEMGHIRLSREADLIVVAPASADLLAKMAHGFADDLARPRHPCGRARQRRPRLRRGGLGPAVGTAPDPGRDRRAAGARAGAGRPQG